MELKATALAVAALAALIAIPGAARADEPDMVCEATVVSGTTHGPIRETVASRAVILWSAQTASTHSMRYSNWNNARQRDVSCDRYTSTFGLNLWECRAVATPCRLR